MCSMIRNKKLFIICVVLIFFYGCIVPGREVNFKPVDKNQIVYNGWQLYLTCIDMRENSFSCFPSIKFYKNKNKSPNISPYEARLDSFEIIYGDTKYSEVNPDKDFIPQMTKKDNIETETRYHLYLLNDTVGVKKRPLLHFDPDLKFIYFKAFISFKSKETGEIEEKIVTIKLKKEIDRWAFIIPME